MGRILLGRLRNLVTQYGAIVAVNDSTGTLRKIRDDDPDTWELAENVEEFRVEGKWHKRADFENLMHTRLQPGTAMQIA